MIPFFRNLFGRHEKPKPRGLIPHAFVQDENHPEGRGCAVIVEGQGWTAMDPICCRRPADEHATPQA